MKTIKAIIIALLITNVAAAQVDEFQAEYVGLARTKDSKRDNPLFTYKYNHADLKKANAIVRISESEITIGATEQVFVHRITNVGNCSVYYGVTKDAYFVEVLVVRSLSGKITCLVQRFGRNGIIVFPGNG